MLYVYDFYLKKSVAMIILFLAVVSIPRKG